ncbi:MAG: DUF1587 domain-containing protein [Akkermansiaceae bacterium]|nr:DUF1587 domain-containing protein [Akkermansiaceae bacterium]
MPPKKEPRPDAAKLKKTISSLLNTIEPPLALRRLNRVEYELTVRDLLGIDTSLADLFVSHLQHLELEADKFATGTLEGLH